MVWLVILRLKPTLCTPTQIWTAQLHTKHTYSRDTDNPDTADQHHMIPASSEHFLSQTEAQRGGKTLWLTNGSVWCQNKIKSWKWAKGQSVPNDEHFSFFVCNLFIGYSDQSKSDSYDLFCFPTLDSSAVFISFQRKPEQ